jgi:hypothetical protein
MMKNKYGFIIAGLICSVISTTALSDCIKKIVIIRHGEVNFNAPYGQLDCQGLNRALALNRVLNAQYGIPRAIYASNPNVTIYQNNACYPYVRALTTIEPNAIAHDMSVLVTYGFGNYGGPASPPDPTVPRAEDIPSTWVLPLPQQPTGLQPCGGGRSTGDVDLAREILKTEDYCGQTIFVAWEHDNIPIIAYSFYYLLGLNPSNVIPLWPFGECFPYYNFDTEYVVEINQSANPPSIHITLNNEGLNGQPTTCPL